MSETFDEWEIEPLVPLIVRTNVPTEAFRFGVIVNVVDPDPVTVVGLNEADVRDGRPVTEKLTVPVKPFTGAIVTENVVDDFLATVREVGVTERVKSAEGEVTTSVTAAVCVRVPSVAVIVRGYVPAAVVFAVEIDKVDEPEPATDVGLKDPVAPDGKPDTLNETVPV